MHIGSTPFARTAAGTAAILGLITAAGWSKYVAAHERGVHVIVRGIVAGSYFTPPAGSTPSTTIASAYANATVCADENENATCDLDEERTSTDVNGAFELSSRGPVIAEISNQTLNAGHAVTQRLVLRATVDQILDSATQVGNAPADRGRPGIAPQGPPLKSAIAITPLSTEAARMMENDGLTFADARQKLATRLNVLPSEILAAPNRVTNDAQLALLTESVVLTNRFALAAKMVDRHDVSPAARAADPAAQGPAITMKEAFQAAMNLEQIPRYDHVFVIMLENKATSSIRNSPFAPKINAYLNANTQFTSYFATGNPSEPNRVAVASGDDFGITDDSAWACVPAGDTADLPDDPLPAGMSPCTNATNHNLKNTRNLLTALSASGMKWRVYNESMNPGRDWRLNSAADATITAPDHVYPAGSPVGAKGDANLVLTMPGSLYATKHNESVNFQDVRSAADFVSNNRTMGGGQFDDALKQIAPAGWDMDQLGTDLWSGDVGQLNFLEPDQCDDMHGVTLQGTIAGSTTKITASDCEGSAIIFRGDNYTDYLIRKIQASPIWTNPEKRVAIVMMFDEGSATTGFNSCCGWNPAGKPTSGGGLPAGPLLINQDGSVSVQSIARYQQGNKGHGTSIFGVITNQPGPKSVVDSDAYSHVSFVRTLQDMFGLADPGDDWSYMNRTKYSNAFIAAHLPFLPEYTESGDTHFDAVRPMNHAFVIPDGYVQKSGFLNPPGPQVGPDADQRNGWAIR